MNDAEKQSECLRICGPNVTPDTHRMAPEICPILQGYWHDPKSKPGYVTHEMPAPGTKEREGKKK